jgi:hypothetical protein
MPPSEAEAHHRKALSRRTLIRDIRIVIGKLLLILTLEEDEDSTSTYRFACGRTIRSPKTAAISLPFVASKRTTTLSFPATAAAGT